MHESSQEGDDACAQQQYYEREHQDKRSEQGGPAQQGICVATERHTRQQNRRGGQKTKINQEDQEHELVAHAGDAKNLGP